MEENNIVGINYASIGRNLLTLYFFIIHRYFQ